MATPRDIDTLLKHWDFQPGEANARLIKAKNGRDVLQMRIDMGVLQMETAFRPDGLRPHGAETYFDYLVGEVIREGDSFRLSKEQCAEADREFVQFYHRRICWLSLREYSRAAKDADHSLSFMDFVRDHSPDDEWTLSHEQYRPFVLFHRVQAAALAALEEQGAESAIGEINRGLEGFRALFARYDAADHYSDDELVRRLEEMREGVRQRYEVGRTLDEQLAAAVHAENYELAAKIRDRMRSPVAAQDTSDGSQQSDAAEERHG
ncbi:MAG: UvrB/UvrC motif-containing protein [Planctomycetota bacterium]|nr:UvrB/UvrC motif-containing protein [Planctomycetia bacterium]